MIGRSDLGSLVGHAVSYYMSTAGIPRTELVTWISSGRTTSAALFKKKEKTSSQDNLLAKPLSLQNPAYAYDHWLPQHVHITTFERQRRISGAIYQHPLSAIVSVLFIPCNSLFLVVDSLRSVLELIEASVTLHCHLVSL